MTESKGILLFFLVCLTAFVRAETGQADTEFIGAAHKGEWVWIRSTPGRAVMKAGRVCLGDEGKSHEIHNGYPGMSVTKGAMGRCQLSGYVDP